ncbi:hypothetical protein KDA06_04610 [Candidatus Saccharibacteria bacterium]|jgi:hypothetical protein|nr:hypothetical protein [Candidatus Saccharibacteria bacterium]HPR09796.1 hypothetical protein [Candidatus Saccharibacteria bacterium]
MTATNHALTGAVIGLTIGNPLIAIPLAFVSHFVLDTIPHFGFKGTRTDEQLLGQRWFKWLLVTEALLCFMIVLTLWLQQPHQWLVGAVSAFVATSPDLYSIPRFLKVNKWRQAPVKWNAFRRFHDVIQTETMWGAAVEAVWLSGILYIFMQQLGK